jgi:PAS domain-containing protein
MASATAAFALLLRRLRDVRSASESRQRPWVVALVATPICVTSITDVLLPLFDVSFPRLGSPAFACLGALGVWLVHRYGHSVLTPSSLADEILSALPDGVALVHADRRIRRANPALLRLAGRSREQLEGFDLAALFEAPIPALGTRREVSARLLRPFAASIPVGVGASQLRDRRGNELGLVVVLRDLREVDALRERAVTAARMAAVGELAAGGGYQGAGDAPGRKGLTGAGRLRPAPPHHGFNPLF